MSADPRPTPQAPDDDPYLWLEEIDSERALAWVEAETARTLARFGGARFARDRDALAAMWDRKDKIAHVTRRGGEVYNFWIDGEHARGIWRRASWASYLAGEPEWDVLLDVDALAEAEGEDWVWGGSSMRQGDRSRAILSLHRGGGDAGVLREYDLDAKTFVADGFVAPEAKGGANWVDKDTLVAYRAHGEGMATRSGYARTARLWRRGQPFERAEVIHEAEVEDLWVGAGLDRTVDPPRWCFVTSASFFSYDLWIGDLSNRVKVPVPADAAKDVHADWLLVSTRTPWTVGGRAYPAGALLGMRLSRALDGETAFELLFEPAERRTLEYFEWVGDKLVLLTLDDLAPALYVLTPADAGWSSQRILGLPEAGVVDIGRLDAYAAESDGLAILYLQDPVTPQETQLIDLAPPTPPAPKLLRRMPAFYDATGIVVSRRDAIASDGERIPYVEVGPRDLQGPAFVHMHGYGGFEVSERPYYKSHLGKLWLERGGVCVSANIRGGGEFGPRWHEAGRREKSASRTTISPPSPPTLFSAA